MTLPIFLGFFALAAAIWAAIALSRRAAVFKNESVLEDSNSSENREILQSQVKTEELGSRIQSQMVKAHDEHNAFVENLVNKHLNVLSKKIRRHLRIDEYGKETGYNEVGDEIAYFVSHVVKTEPGYHLIRKSLIDLKIDLTLLGRNRDDYDIDRLATDLGEKVDEGLVPWVYSLTAGNKIQHDRATDAEINLLSGAEFEIYCEERLKKLGWSVHRKGGVGDQGVDLIANRDNFIVAIQCKRYGNPIGNHAIQQVEAGRQFEEAHYAAVVSNTSYTRSAQQLASKLGVLLLHHSDLDMLDENLLELQKAGRNSNN